MRSRRLHALLFSVIAFVARAAYGDEDMQIVVGQRVMPVKDSTTMRTAPSADAELVAWRPGTCLMTVAEVKGGWLRTDRGWIMRSAVVPCDRAIAFFTVAISRSPSVFAICSRSGARLDANEYQAALEDANEAVRLDRTDARGFFCRGLAAASMGDMDSAFDDFGRAIALDNGFAAAYNSRAMTRFRKGDFSAAVADCVGGVIVRRWRTPWWT